MSDLTPAARFNLALHRFALGAVGVGVTVGVLVGLSAWMFRGQFEKTLFGALLFAVVAAYPVLWNQRRLRAESVSLD